MEAPRGILTHHQEYLRPWQDILALIQRKIMKLPHCWPGCKPGIIRRSHKLLLTDKSPQRACQQRSSARVLSCGLGAFSEAAGLWEQLECGSSLLPETGASCQASQPRHTARSGNASPPPLTASPARPVRDRPGLPGCLADVTWAVSLRIKQGPDRQSPAEAWSRASMQNRGEGTEGREARRQGTCGVRSHWASG